MLKTCIHQYLTKCKTNPQPPGFADFLRGTRTLYLLSKKYDYIFSRKAFYQFKYYYICI